MINVYFLKDSGKFKKDKKYLLERKIDTNYILTGMAEALITRLDRLALEPEKKEPTLKPEPPKKKRMIKKAVSKVAEKREKAVVD